MSENVSVGSNGYNHYCDLEQISVSGLLSPFQHNGYRLSGPRTLRDMSFMVTWGPQGNNEQQLVQRPKMPMNLGTERGPNEMFINTL